MKDKRQKMSFTWPYGDPQMFAYMLSAVAASSGFTNPNQLPVMLPGHPYPQIPNTNHHIHLQQQAQQYNTTFNNQTLNNNKHFTLNDSKLTINTEIQSQFSAKTPSPNILSSSSLSSSSSSSITHENSNDLIKISQPQPGFTPLGISSPQTPFFIPTSSSPKIFQNSNIKQLSNMIYENHSQGLLSKSSPHTGTHTKNNISFKSPAFGLANIEQHNLTNTPPLIENSFTS